MDRKSEILEWLQSEEGQKALQEWADERIQQEAVLDSQIERFHTKYQNRLDEVIQKLKDKYESDWYWEKEYSKGREPRTPLYWLLLDYARKYCKPCEEEKYLNMFTGEAYYIGSYVIQVMHGQGSIIRIDKQYTND